MACSYRLLKMWGWIELFGCRPKSRQAAHVGQLRLSNGHLLTIENVEGNDGADSDAKEGGQGK